jgi:hypothetical protein
VEEYGLQSSSLYSFLHRVASSQVHIILKGTDGLIFVFVTAYLEVDEDIRVFWHGELLVESYLRQREEADADAEPQQKQQNNDGAHPRVSKQVGGVKFLENVTE